VKIGAEHTRSGVKKAVSKTAGADAFPGKVIVLVDNNSHSACEMFARIIQLEKRGTVIGNRTPGSVMEAQFFWHPAGNEYSGTEITIASLIMSDGNSLEGVGVTPDIVVLPGPKDLASGDDPVLAYAARQAGVEITAEAAGKLFPYEWPPE
jgi:C-terminal processing protease CtpA/Prc